MSIKITSQETREISTVYAAFKCIYGTKINIHRSVVPDIDNSFTKESATYSSTVWFNNFISITYSLGNRIKMSADIHSFVVFDVCVF